MNSIYLKWRVQVRKSRAHKWVNKGLFEVRYAARADAWIYREIGIYPNGLPYGFGNTRVIRHEVKR